MTTFGHTLTGQNSLGKVNNHVSRLGQNVVPLSHEEVMAVKAAFVKALASGGGGGEEIASVRRELGLAPDPGAEAVDRNLGERSMKPLTRQQVREILDRYAETINAHPGAPRIRTAAERNARLSDEERNTRTARRDAVNNALDESRTVSANNDILLFERLVAGDFDGIFREDAERMAEMARQKLASARERLAANPPADQRLHVTWELPGGQRVDLLAPVGLADFVARLEDALFLLSIERPRRGNAEPPPPSPPPVTNAAWNAALKSALLADPRSPSRTTSPSWRRRWSTRRAPSSARTRRSAAISASPESTLSDAFQSITGAMLKRTVLTEMKKFATGAETQFDLDRDRVFSVSLAGVGEVSNDPAVARDQFAKFVTKNPAATYASLDDRPVYQMVDRGDQPDKYRQAIFAIPAHFNLGIECGPSFVADLR